MVSRIRKEKRGKEVKERTLKEDINIEERRIVNATIPTLEIEDITRLIGTMRGRAGDENDIFQWAVESRKILDHFPTLDRAISRMENRMEARILFVQSFNPFHHMLVIHGRPNDDLTSLRQFL